MPFELRHPAHLALLALLVPLVLLYVLRIRREARRVPSTWLWRSAERDLLAKQPFRRFFPYLSLILEALALGALALAFAQPIVRGGQIDSLHLAIVIDTSASMGAIGADGRPRIELAREAARGLSRQLAPGADALVIDAGREPRVVSPLERDPKRIDAAIERVKLGEVEGDLGGAISLATDHLRSHPGSSRIVVVTDGALARPDSFAAASLPVDVVRVGSPAENIAVIRADVARTSEPTGRDRVQVFALVKNFGKNPHSVFATLLPQNSTTPLASRRLDLAAGEEAPVILSFDAAPADKGMGLIVDLAAGDALRADDRAYVRVPAGQHLPVVLSPKTASPWLARALASDPGVELLGADPGALGPDVPYEAFVVIEGACPERIPGSDFLLVNPPAGPCHGAVLGAPLERPTITSWTDGDPRLRFTSFEGVVIQRANTVVPDGPRSSLVRSREGTLIADISGAGRTGTLVGFDVGESNWPLRASFVLFVRNLIELARSHRAGVAQGPARTGEPLALR
ncbi:MAG TPA: VWA domain-containing protein, partial [Polyangiaceae bacterium]